MGLDMYLNRMPRYKEVTANQINVIENYFDLEEEKKHGGQYANSTLKQWCGHDESELPDKETIEYFRQFYVTRYSSWDTAHKYGHKSIMEEIGYWRKANEIHAWLVDHVQDGIDDCDYHYEVTKEVLELLRATCQLVILNSDLVPGKVIVGYSFDKNGNEITDYEDGKVVKDSSAAERLLPTQGGFFFGDTSYNEWYINDLKETIKIIDKVLAETDFETQMIFYVSSW